MKRLSLVLLVSLLGACAGAHTFDGSMRAAYVGQPLAQAIQDFGAPTGQYDSAAGTVFVWQKRDAESIFGPAVTRGSGYQILGSMPDGHGLYAQGVVYNRCVIRATTSKNMVMGMTFEGNPSGCEIITGYRKKPLGRGGQSIR